MILRFSNEELNKWAVLECPSRVISSFPTSQKGSVELTNTIIIVCKTYRKKRDIIREARVVPKWSNNYGQDKQEKNSTLRVFGH